MIYALGMSFTTFNDAIDPSTDFVLQNGNFEPVGMELNCCVGSATCRVQFGEGGPVFDLYDEMDLSTKKIGGDGTIIILNP